MTNDHLDTLIARLAPRPASNANPTGNLLSRASSGPSDRLLKALWPDAAAG